MLAPVIIQLLMNCPFRLHVKMNLVSDRLSASRSQHTAAMGKKARGQLGGQ